MGAQIPVVARCADWQHGKWTLAAEWDQHQGLAIEDGLPLDDQGASDDCPQCARLEEEARS